MTTFLQRGYLIFKVNGCRAGVDACLCYLISVERPAKSSLNICDNGGEPIDVALVMQVLKLISPEQGIVYLPDHIRHTVGWI